MSENKFNILVSALLIAFALVFTLLVKFVAVGPAGETLTQVGFSALNKAFFDATGVNETFYIISSILGYVVLALVVVYLFLAIREMVKKKTIFKIDKSWWALAVFYIAVLATYFIFEKLAINNRPIFIDGKLEASYPSTHTLLALSVCFSSIIINRTFYKNSKIAHIANIVMLVISIAMAICRLISGYHWLTDIIGGILITTALVMCFYTAVCYFEDKKEAKKE